MIFELRSQLCIMNYELKGLFSGQQRLQVVERGQRLQGSQIVDVEGQDAVAYLAQDLCLIHISEPTSLRRI